MTASSVNEEAQESDALGGSFFTHYLTSGLMGAADDDRNEVVTLDEAYRHVSEATIRATSQTLAGTQHPTLRYKLRGQGKLALTVPNSRCGRSPGSASASERARLHYHVPCAGELPGSRPPPGAARGQ
ncbi:hypothetical protein [Sorangium sp. So ce388]|uniref:hypothetical protein n=1 Tax=Sorangium sp. So ce388 TaxID=3133309 RepID=UPI003F5C5C93